jgi:hypothetical protein
MLAEQQTLKSDSSISGDVNRERLKLEGLLLLGRIFTPKKSYGE